MKKYDLVLLGGGHTHVLLIRALAMRPLPEVRVTLVSESTLTPYSGMLPGFVAGHYSLEQTNIDLNQLCRKAGVRWIKDRANDLDLENKNLGLREQANLEFDAISIDIGSTPDQRIKGSAEFATGVKPIAGFQQRWRQLLASLENQSKPKLDWGVIGAGAGGVELVLAMAFRARSNPGLKFHLIYRGASVLPGYPAGVVKRVERKLNQIGVVLHPNFSVAEVTERNVINPQGQSIGLDQSIWCTGAVGATWLAKSSLASTDKNFIEVNDYLQSTSHDFVFAAGDIAHMVNDPRPKAGVFAVRQAPQLEHNLRCWFADQPLKQIKLQTQFLSLLALGDKTAVASRNGVSLSGAWVWRWKDDIDQKFMRQFVRLPMRMGRADKMPAHDTMHCGGCSSKLGPQILRTNLAASMGLLAVEDASVWEPTKGSLMAQSIDGFRSFASDDYRFAQLGINHALSDVYAMGATPKNAQAWINLAFNQARLQQRDHLRIMSALCDSLEQQGVTLVGGHSSQGSETHLGIVVNGELRDGHEWSKSGAHAGDVLLMSKGLGVGVILAADMQAAAPADAIDAAYQSMLESNQGAAQALLEFSPSAVTDITGFGLLGHLLEMLDGASLNARLDLSQISIIDGALELIKNGFRSSLQPQLLDYLQRCVIPDGVDRNRLELLIDPQTSGGLLLAINPVKAQTLLKRSSKFVVIGELIARDDKASLASVLID